MEEAHSRVLSGGSLAECRLASDDPGLQQNTAGIKPTEQVLVHIA